MSRLKARNVFHSLQTRSYWIDQAHYHLLMDCQDCLLGVRQPARGLPTSLKSEPMMSEPLPPAGTVYRRSLQNILCAAQWCSHTTFTSFYLTDLTVIEEDLKIGPLVTAQQVTQPAQIWPLAFLQTTDWLTPGLWFGLEVDSQGYDLDLRCIYTQCVMVGSLHLQVHFSLLWYTWDVQQPLSFCLLVSGGGGCLQLPDLLVPLAIGSGDSSFLLYSEPTTSRTDSFPSLKQRGLLDYKILKLGTNSVFY